MCDKKPPRILVGICAMLSAFEEHAARDKTGPKDKLSNKELKSLLKEELGEMPESGNCEAHMKELFEKLDADGDGQLDFMEFMALCCGMACAMQCMK